MRYLHDRDIGRGIDNREMWNRNKEKDLKSKEMEKVGTKERDKIKFKREIE